MLHDFAKADHAWLEPLLGAIADEAPSLAEGADDKFQSRVAHAIQLDAGAAEKPSAPRAKPASRRKEPDKTDRAARAAGQPRGEAPPLVRRVKAD